MCVRQEDVRVLERCELHTREVERVGRESDKKRHSAWTRRDIGDNLSEVPPSALLAEALAVQRCT